MSIESTELATNKGGAPLGNQNAKKGKLWTDALRKAIAQNPHKLRLAAEKLLDDASEGNIMAIKEIKEKKCPLMLKREIGFRGDTKICEIWGVNELIIQFD